MTSPAQQVENTGVDLGDLGPLVQRASEIHSEIRTLKANLEEKGEHNEERIAELTKQLEPIKSEMNKVHVERVEAKAKADADQILADAQRMAQEWDDAKRRSPSKAHLLGGKVDPTAPNSTLTRFHALVAKARDTHDLEGMQEAQRELRSMGAGDGKATLGDSDGAGGYLIPNAVVSPVIEQATARNIWRQELNVVRGIRGTTVEVPTEGLTPARATVVAWGATKTNLNFTVASYTATLYTIAGIYDVSNQLLRHSEGAAEDLVRSRLARALALGEAYYILAGSGSSEPKGILTSIGTSGQFVTSFTASGTTLAGSVSKAIATAAGDIAGRNRTATAATLAPARFWDMLSQGTDSAGFFFDPTGGPSGIDATVPNIRVFGLRVFPDAVMVEAGASDDLIVGDYRSASLFIGDDYRVDVSTEANDRWDKNLTGFRAEEELGFNADPYVASGYFQRVLDIQP